MIIIVLVNHWRNYVLRIISNWIKQTTWLVAVEDLKDCDGYPKNLAFRQRVWWVCRAKDYFSYHLHYIFYHLLFFLLLGLAWETKV